MKAPEPKTKTCYKEGVKKPLSEFHKDASASDGYSSSCKICRNKVKREASKKKRDHRPSAKQAPLETQKPLAQREKEALAKCHINAYKALRERYPVVFKVLLQKELDKNPVMIARKWRELPETEGV